MKLLSSVQWTCSINDQMVERNDLYNFFPKTKYVCPLRIKLIDNAYYGIENKTHASYKIGNRIPFNVSV